MPESSTVAKSAVVGDSEPSDRTSRQSRQTRFLAPPSTGSKSQDNNSEDDDGRVIPRHSHRYPSNPASEIEMDTTKGKAKGKAETKRDSTYRSQRIDDRGEPVYSKPADSDDDLGKHLSMYSVIRPPTLLISMFIPTRMTSQLTQISTLPFCLPGLTTASRPETSKSDRDLVSSPFSLPECRAGQCRIRGQL
jgi:hypothetical protein